MALVLVSDPFLAHPQALVVVSGLRVENLAGGQSAGWALQRKGSPIYSHTSTFVSS